MSLQLSSAFTNRDLEVYQTHVRFEKRLSRKLDITGARALQRFCAPEVLNVCYLTDEVMFNMNWQYFNILHDILSILGNNMKLIKAFGVIIWLLGNMTWCFSILWLQKGFIDKRKQFIH